MAVKITLNGETHDLPGPMSVGELLARLAIDPRRVAVEHNLVVLKRPAYDDTALGEGDQLEIVQVVGGGAGTPGSEPAKPPGSRLGPSTRKHGDGPMAQGLQTTMIPGGSHLSREP